MGLLDIGQPTVEDSRYTVPIVLRDGGGEVAALNFRLRYDPALFQPLGAASGPAALAANKMVTANMPTPGEYIVVMMGLNQSTLEGGEVARITLERIAETAYTDKTELSVSEPTLATWEGIELPVRGGSRRIAFGSPPEEEDKETAEEGEGPDEQAPGKQDREAESAPSTNGKAKPSPLRTLGMPLQLAPEDSSGVAESPRKIVPAQRPKKKLETSGPSVAHFSREQAGFRRREGATDNAPSAEETYTAGRAKSNGTVRIEPIAHATVGQVKIESTHSKATEAATFSAADTAAGKETPVGGAFSRRLGAAAFFLAGCTALIVLRKKLFR